MIDCVKANWNWKLESEIGNWEVKLNSEIEMWNWKLKLKTENRKWKSKLKTENWKSKTEKLENWKMENWIIGKLENWIFLVYTNVDYITFGFGSIALSLILNLTPFWDFLGPSWLIFGLELGPKSFLGPSYID